MQLVRYEAARQALAAAHRVDEVKRIRDKAEAMAAYARQAKDTQLVEYATEIKVRAERRCGELLAKADRAKVGENQFTRYSDHSTTRPTLKDIGLTPDQSSRYQQLAAMPEEHFETAVATAKATAGQVTTAFMLRAARKNRPAKPRPSPEDDTSIEDEIEDPRNYRTAYLLRAEQAIRFAAYSGPITRDIVATTRAVAAAWTKLARKLEKSL